METREAQLSDLAGLTTLFDAYRQFYRQQSDGGAASSFIRERLARKDSRIFLCLDEGELLGFVQLYPSFSSVAMRPIFILNDLFVDPDARNRGAAMALLSTAEAFARESGAVRLTLATEIANVAAQTLYRKMGWQKDEAFLHFNKSVEA